MYKKIFQTSLLLSAMLLCSSFSASAAVVNPDLEEETQITTSKCQRNEGGCIPNMHCTNDVQCYPGSCGGLNMCVCD